MYGKLVGKPSERTRRAFRARARNRDPELRRSDLDDGTKKNAYRRRQNSRFETRRKNTVQALPEEMSKQTGNAPISEQVERLRLHCFSSFSSLEEEKMAEINTEQSGNRTVGGEHLPGQSANGGWMRWLRN